MEKQVIEYAGIPVGITVPDGDRYKFIAVKFPVIELDGGTYNSIADLRRAIHSHMVSSKDEAQTFSADLARPASAVAKAFNIA